MSNNKYVKQMKKRKASASIQKNLNIKEKIATNQLYFSKAGGGNKERGDIKKNQIKKF